MQAKAADKSVTEAETALFAAKVQELLVQHGLAMSDVDTREVQEEVGQNRHDPGPVTKQRSVLLRAVCRYFMCEAVGPARGMSTWTIVGRPTNVMVALDMFQYLYETTVRLRNEYGRQNRHLPGSAKFDFGRGCMLRLAERLDEARIAETEKPKEFRVNGNPGNLPALLDTEYKLARHYVRANMQTTQSRVSVREGGHAAAGRAAAESVGLHRQVGGGGGRLQIGRK